MGNRWTGRTFIFAAVVSVAVIAVFFMMFLLGDDGDQVDLTTILTMAENGEITSITIDGDRLIAVHRRNDRQLIAPREPGVSIFDMLHSAGVNPVEHGIEINVQHGGGLGNLRGILVQSLLMLLFGIILAGIANAVCLRIRRR